MQSSEKGSKGIRNVQVQLPRSQGKDVYVCMYTYRKCTFMYLMKYSSRKTSSRCSKPLFLAQNKAQQPCRLSLLWVWIISLRKKASFFIYQTNKLHLNQTCCVDDFISNQFNLKKRVQKSHCHRSGSSSQPFLPSCRHTSGNPEKCHTKARNSIFSKSL